MSNKWYILTLYGSDQLGIVSRITNALYNIGANLGETSMSRLGNYFTILALVEFNKDQQILSDQIQNVTDALGLRFHLDQVPKQNHKQLIPNIRITFYGNDRAGLVAKVSAELSRCKVNILDLQTDVTDDPGNPMFVMTIEGLAMEGTDQLEDAISQLKSQGINIRVETIDTLIG